MRIARFALLLFAIALSAHAQSWQFAVSGDSRDCGDVIMPAIAASVGATQAQFYWHLGDFRKIYDFDEDMQAVKAYTILDYENAAWPDFIAQQVTPFTKQVFLAVGNHEVVQPKGLPQWLGQFADWLTQPEIVAQRLKDDPTDHQLKAYYHVIRNGVDFITTDSSAYAFDNNQLSWITARINADVADPTIKTIVVGGHAALPHSLSCDHSMNQTAAGEQSGTTVYKQLLAAQKAGKKVYLLASHSHFYQTNIFDTDYWRNNGGVLPGWIIGTAGAVRYRLPNPNQGRTDVYGYLLATVSPDGSISFDFKEIDRNAVPAATVTRYGDKLVNWCFTDNKDMRQPKPNNCEKNVPCAMP